MDGCIGESCFVRCMNNRKPKLTKPTNPIPKHTILKEIRAAKRSAMGMYGPPDAHVFAMGYVTEMLLIVADNKHTTHRGLEALYKMRLALAALKDM